MYQASSSAFVARKEWITSSARPGVAVGVALEEEVVHLLVGYGADPFKDGIIMKRGGEVPHLHEGDIIVADMTYLIWWN
ncbi:hypothetical protein Tco_0543038 [Tanacetum coccineum]